MIPWVQLGAAEAPDGGGQLRLMQRGPEFSIMIGGVELMNSRRSGSEEALAELACERLADCAAPRLLIGGLGMGFTLRAALARLGPQAKVSIAEIVPAVVAWARGPLAELFGASLTDPRVAVHQTNVAALIAQADGAQANGAYDAILLDVDNGPGGLVRPANDRLYDAQGLLAAHQALCSGGVLAVWSSGPDTAFTERLRRGGYTVTEAKVRSHGSRGRARHVIWLASRR